MKDTDELLFRHFSLPILWSVNSGMSPQRRELKNKNRTSYRKDLDSEVESDDGVSDVGGDMDSDRCSTPESQKNTTCSVCSSNVTSSDKSLQCDKCNEWCHIKAIIF